MDPQTQALSNYNQVIEQELMSERLKRMQLENNQSEQTAFGMKKDTGVIIYQLDNSEDLDRLYHLFRGDVLEDGVWKKTNDPRLRIFTDLGVKQIINYLYPYMSKNITLGNYTEDQINEKMRIFTRYFTNFVLNRREDFFYYPKSEEIFNNLIKIKRSTKEYDVFSDEELYDKAEEWSKNELQIKIIHFKMAVIVVTDLVHACYNRALNGATHKGVTRNYNVSEHSSQGAPVGLPSSPQKSGWLKWKGG